MDQRTNGPTDQRTNGPMDQRTNGPTDQWTNGPTKRGVESRSTRLKTSICFLLYQDIEQKAIHVCSIYSKYNLSHLFKVSLHNNIIS